MAIFPLAPDQTVAQMWSNGARGGTNITSTPSKVQCSQMPVMQTKFILWSQSIANCINV